MRMHSYINVVNYPKNTVKPMNQNLGTLRILSENKQGERLLTKPSSYALRHYSCFLLLLSCFNAQNVLLVCSYSLAKMTEQCSVMATCKLHLRLAPTVDKHNKTCNIN